VKHPIDILFSRPTPLLLLAALAAGCMPGADDGGSRRGGTGGGATGGSGGGGGGGTGSGGGGAGTSGSGGGAAIDAAPTPDMGGPAPDAAAEGGGGFPPGVPSSDDREAMAAFLAAKEYQKAPWISETAMSRPASSSVSPHGRVRVWMNPQLVTSLKEGRDGLPNRTTMMDNPPHDQWSMAVKELWNESGTTLEGVAAMLRTQSGRSGQAWTYFCHAPTGRCVSNRPSPESDPIHGKGLGTPGQSSQCAICHGGLIFTKAP
jgi:hypothetical protein